MQRQLEAQLAKLKADLDVLSEYGKMPQRNAAEAMLAYDSRQHKADATLRNAQRKHQRQNTLSSSLLVTVQSIVVKMRVGGATRENVYKMTATNEGLQHALQLSEQKLVGILAELPPDLQYMDNGSAGGSLNMAAKAAAQGNNGRIAFNVTQDFFNDIDLINPQVKATDVNAQQKQKKKAKDTGSDRRMNRVSRKTTIVPTSS